MKLDVTSYKKGKINKFDFRIDLEKMHKPALTQ